MCADMVDFADLVTYYPQAYYKTLQHIRIQCMCNQVMS